MVGMIRMAGCTPNGMPNAARKSNAHSGIHPTYQMAHRRLVRGLYATCVRLLPTHTTASKLRHIWADVLLCAIHVLITRLPIAMSLITYIVEDSVTIRDNLIATLEEIAPVKVVGFAETETEASLWLSSNGGDWQLAIVDLFLKEGSGLGVLKGCQSRQHHQKVVVLTNYATDDIRKRCTILGADAVFDKSNEIEALLDFCSASTTR